MTRTNSIRRFTAAIAGAMLIALNSAAFAAEPPVSAATAPTREMRESMATLHEQMAACLRSDKSISECRTEMQKHCQDVMGNQGCTRMMGTGGMMGMGGGMGMGRRMHGRTTPCPPSSTSPPK